MDFENFDNQTIEQGERPHYQPGWYLDIPNEKYHGSFGTSSTQGKLLIEKTPAHFVDSRSISIEPKANMILGSAVHSLLLENQHFDRDFFILPDLNLKNSFDRARKAQLIIENPGKQALSEQQYENAKKMAENLGNFIADDWSLSSMFEDGISESSIFWWYKTKDLDDGHDYKEYLKCRPDRISTSHSVLMDVKSCMDASYTGFKKAIEYFYYHFSAAWYLDGVNQCKPLLNELGHFAYTNFVFLCVENQPPYLPAAYVLTPKYLEIGKTLYRRALNRLSVGRRDGWPGYPPGIREMEPNENTYFHIV